MMFGQCECYKCKQWFDSDDGREIQIEEQTGRSGNGYAVSANLTGKLNPRGFLSFGRKYYRNKTVFICDDCYENNSKGFTFQQFWELGFWMTFAAVVGMALKKLL